MFVKISRHCLLIENNHPNLKTNLADSQNERMKSSKIAWFLFIFKVFSNYPETWNFQWQQHSLDFFTGVDAPPSTPVFHPDTQSNSVNSLQKTLTSNEIQQSPNIIHHPITTYFEILAFRNLIYRRKHPYTPDPHDPHRPDNPNNLKIESSGHCPILNTWFAGILCAVFLGLFL